ncbi:hypothetical protein QFZ79_003394 [Arthrobacter sp. V4I6]|uniref:DUF6895 family protein n=1 Tax=unclassified Arthrobacter TaxID=235627 RepID=UPI0027896F92|nr:MULTISPECIES: hypothetical protein [unclassified Arthrobacter]MDQ0821022.1 hypothetical protein [Arthrobacter sp. V1I7]MDQ0855283.1 hypothetical protein [Arthrobacter sp. V4I6]
MDWLALQLNQFVPRQDSKNESQNKPLLELIVLMVHGIRHGLIDEQPSATQIIDRLTTAAQVPELRNRPVRNSNHLILRAGLCAFLRITSNPDPAHEAAIQRAIDTGLLDQTGRLPHHVMIERTILDWGGFSHHLPPLAELTASSLLVRNPDALYQTERSIYELTHDVMFGCAFGDRPPSELTPQQLDQLHRVVSDALVRFGRQGHWDLVGELLLSWDCLRFNHDTSYENAWSELTAAQDLDGSIVAIEQTDPGAYATRTGSAPPDERRFAERYHSTLVLVLATMSRIGRETLADPDHEVRSVAPRAERTNQSSTSQGAAWFAAIMETPQSTPTAVMGALVGTTLISAIDERATALADRAAKQLTARLQESAQLAAVPATLTLAVFGILRGRGMDVPILTGFVDGVRSIVDSQTSGSQSRWCEERAILTQLGLLAPANLPAPAQLWQALAVRQVDPDHVRRLAAAYGDAPLPQPDGQVARRLESLAIDTLRRSNLVTGCSLLRSAHAFGPLVPERIRSVTAFLHAQQCPDGGFGVIPPATETGEMDPDIDIRLPISLAVWWALARMNTSFRLFTHPPSGRSRP